MRLLPIVCLSASVVAFVASSAVAQETAVAPAHISLIEGSATIERDGEIEPVALNMPVIDGDYVRTAIGRLQITFPDGSAVDLDQNSEIKYLGGARVRVYAGTVEHRPAEAVQSPSAPYLTADSQAYAADLDHNGTWQYDTTYGNVWYPSVAADWRPYYDGYWSSVPAYGWTWVGYNRWAWPTHHYGRWGYAHSRWFWIPGRVYANAWVSWGTAPGYVSWCPLGFNNQPVVGLSVGYSRGWNAWTIVPRDHFGWRGYPTHRYAVEPYRVAASTPFIVQRQQPALSVRGAGSSVVTAPRTGSYATSRTAPYGAPRAGSYDGPRAGSYDAPRPGTYARPRAGEAASGVAVPRYSNPGYSRTDSINRQPATGTFTNRGERGPSTNGATTRTMPQREGGVGRVRSYAPPAPVQRPSPAPPPQMSRPSPERASSYAPPMMSRPSAERGRPPSAPQTSSAPRANSGTGGGGRGHMTNGPHADRGPSGGRQGGGGHSNGSHGGGSQGTAVRRPR